MEMIACSENIFVHFEVNQNDIVVSEKNDVAFHCSLTVKKVSQHSLAMNLLKSVEIEKLLSYLSPQHWPL